MKSWQILSSKVRKEKKKKEQMGQIENKEQDERFKFSLIACK